MKPGRRRRCHPGHTAVAAACAVVAFVFSRGGLAANNTAAPAAGAAVAPAAVAAATAAPPPAQWVGRFSGAGEPPPPWRLLRFDDSIAPTRYRLRDWDGVAAVEAHAVASMALLARPLAIDLESTPVLCWRWRIEAPLQNADMNRKDGDDYAARVYLSFDVAQHTLGLGDRLALALARSVHDEDIPDAAINYIWDNRHAVGLWRANVYTDRARMLVLRSGGGEAKRWLLERRDVALDFLQAFGHAPLRLTALAIAADTDNTGEQAHAGFADFRFVGRNAPC